MQKRSITSLKREIRKVVRERLGLLSSAMKLDASVTLTSHLISALRLNKMDKKTVLLIFANLEDEPSLLGLFGSREGFSLVFPKVEKGSSELSLWKVRTVDDLIPGYAGIREPDPDRCESVPLADIDGIIVPGVAFDRESGARLGRGGGFYDRLLASKGAAPAIGVCFDCQIHSPIPLEPHDCHVSAVVTESGFFHCDSDSSPA